MTDAASTPRVRTRVDHPRSATRPPRINGVASDRLKIALLCPVWFPVPPPRYGGIESVVALLAEVLTAAGHDVTVFASGDSTPKARLESVYSTAPSERIGNSIVELRHVLACFERSDSFDVIGDHTGLIAAALAPLSASPVLHTVHGPLDGELGDAYEELVRVAPGVGLVSLSRSQRRHHPQLPWVANCPNAIDPSRYSWSPRRGEYLAFVGRMGNEKGCHHAIAAARACGIPLKIAAKCREPAEHAYFADHVAPQLGAGVEYLGEVGHEERVRLLQGARATLFPVDWEEPFGLVMIESLACGTPVVATRRGSVPEVLEDGRTGFIVESHEALAAAISDADRIDRTECRRAAEERFAPRNLLAAYTAAFRAALERTAPHTTARTRRPSHRAASDSAGRLGKIRGSTAASRPTTV